MLLYNLIDCCYNVNLIYVNKKARLPENMQNFAKSFRGDLNKKEQQNKTRTFTAAILIILVLADRFFLTFV